MLPADAFLRLLPRTMHPKQAVLIDGLVFAADAVAFSMAAIRTAAAQAGTQIGQADASIRVGMFVHAWTIVDALHTIREIVIALPYCSEAANQLRHKYEGVKYLRNQMDHLAQRASNISRSRNPPPVYGTLGYIVVSADDVTVVGGYTELKSCSAIAISTGRHISNHEVEMINPLDKQIRSPVGLFRLDAFGESIELEQAESDLRVLMTEINTQIGNQIRQKASRSASAEVGIEELLRSPLCNSVAVVDMDICDR